MATHVKIYVALCFQCLTTVTPLELRRSDPRLIPDRLLLNHKVKFLERQEAQGTNETENYVSLKEAKENKDYAAILEVNQQIYNFGEVELLDNEGCRQKLVEEKLDDLLEHFLAETDGRYKSDICRLAQLLRGGYYFDNDMLALSDLRQFIPADTSFASAIALWSSRGAPHSAPKKWLDPTPWLGKDSLFNSIIAVAPEHPIIYRALNITVETYSFFGHDARARRFPKGAGKNFCLGPWILRQAYEWYANLPDNSGQMRVGRAQHQQRERYQSTYLFDESDNTTEYGWPHKPLSNAFIGDFATKQMLFWSRVSRPPSTTQKAGKA